MSRVSRVIYYYQTFVGLDKLWSHPHDVDVIILASIHFGTENGTPYIHLNDHPPTDKIFDKVWDQIDQFSTEGVEIILLVGGAGKAFADLFGDYTTYYQLLKQLIETKTCIKGIELDVEEVVDVKNIKMLINDLVRDFGENLIITMAPVSSAMINDRPGLGGFVYKDLYDSDEGKHISWFNVQCYGEFTEDTYENIIKNGYPPHKIVMGMISSDFDKNTFHEAIDAVKKIKDKYPSMGGIDNWEYFDSPPDSNDPSEWSKQINYSINLSNQSSSNTNAFLQ